jgi:hypothetical protein
LVKDNIAVHGLWIGKNFSPVELLCIHSYLENGHEFHLWAYDFLETKLPEGVILEEASKIIPRENVFCYKYLNQFGHGKGSYAGFSDIFRYKLLYQYGGWWTDMDVVCLKMLDFPGPYVFRTHHELKVVGNIMKCPAGSELMRSCYESAVSQVDENNTDWNLPIRILNEKIEEFGLTGYICEFTNRDSWLYVRQLLMRKKKFPDHWFALHLVNEEWRRNRIDKNAIPKRSRIAALLRQYRLYEQAPFSQRMANIFRLVILRFSGKQLSSFIKNLPHRLVRQGKKGN